MKLILAVQVKGNEAIEESAKKIDEVFDFVAERLKDRKYLCGDNFTAADIAFASLCYPIAAAGVPEMWSIRMPPLEKFPPMYQEYISKWLNHPAGKHAVRIYKEHRFKPETTDKRVKMNNPNSRNTFWFPLIVTAALCTGGYYFLQSKI